MEYHVDVTSEDFEQVVIQGSTQRYVVVDFWAPWCSPCKQLKPLLEKLAPEYGFLLAKVNTEEHQEIATQYGVRGIPDVRVYKDGQIVTQFSGAKTENELRELLGQFMLSSADQSLMAIQQLAQEGDQQQVIDALNQLISEHPDNDKIKLTAANYLIETGDVEGGKRILKHIKMSSDYYEMAQNQLALEGFQSACASIDQQTGTALIYAEAACAAMQGDYQNAMEKLIEVFTKDRAFNDGAAKKSLLVLFELLGHDHPLTKQFQRKLMMLLY